MVFALALLSLFGCTKRAGDVAAPQRVGEALGSTTTLPPTASTALTATTTTVPTATTATTVTTATTATTRDTASPTTRTTASRPTTSVISLPPSTQPSPANLRLDVAQGTAPCPALQLPFVAVWSIGNAAPGTGRLAFNNEAARSVPDAGREERCVVAGTHTYTYSAAVAGGRATRTATFSWR